MSSHKRRAEEFFAAKDQFSGQLDRARANARPRMSGAQAQRTALFRLDETGSDNAAVQRCLAPALDAIRGLIRRHRSGPQESAMSAGFGLTAQQREDPLGDLMAVNDQMAALHGSATTHALLGNLARVAAAAVHELAEATGSTPEEALQDLLGKYGS